MLVLKIKYKLTRVNFQSGQEYCFKSKLKFSENFLNET